MKLQNKNIKNILNKTSLTQEALDKVNAKVVSVENQILQTLNFAQNQGDKQKKFDT